ncbi:hypothetical protein F4824DRAFT_372090 [Ustulina deusta]|nr:hypothetical protein F4824DRAFT_372090 [Ustulina deusta]
MTHLFHAFVSHTYTSVFVNFVVQHFQHFRRFSAYSAFSLFFVVFLGFYTVNQSVPIRVAVRTSAHIVYMGVSSNTYGPREALFRPCFEASFWKRCFCCGVSARYRIALRVVDQSGLLRLVAYEHIHVLICMRICSWLTEERLFMVSIDELLYR